MKIHKIYISNGQNIDFCQNYLLSGTVTFRVYYVKNASRDLRLFLSENAHLSIKLYHPLLYFLS